MKPNFELPKSITNPSDSVNRELIKQYEEDSKGLHGHYYGYVEENEDPTKKHRVKVRIPEIHGSIPTEHLPWAVLMTQGFSSDDEEVKFIKKGIGVVVVFLGGDQYNPCIIGRLPSAKNHPKEAEKDHPNISVLYSSDGGTKITHNNKTGEFSMSHEAGTQITIDERGNVEISVKGTSTINTYGKCVINSTESVSVTAPIIEVGDDTHKVIPSTQGVLNCLPTCLFTGAPHTGSKAVGS